MKYIHFVEIPLLVKHSKGAADEPTADVLLYAAALPHSNLQTVYLFVYHQGKADAAGGKRATHKLSSEFFAESMTGQRHLFHRQ